MSCKSRLAASTAICNDRNSAAIAQAIEISTGWPRLSSKTERKPPSPGVLFSPVTDNLSRRLQCQNTPNRGGTEKTHQRELRPSVDCDAHADQFQRSEFCEARQWESHRHNPPTCGSVVRDSLGAITVFSVISDEIHALRVSGPVDSRPKCMHGSSPSTAADIAPHECPIT
jgi:hypothetical protein